MTITLIQTVTASGSSATISLTAIPQTFTDLLIVISGRSSASAVSSGCGFTFFDPASVSTSGRKLEGNGSGTYSQAFATGSVPAANATANTHGSIQMYLPNYRSGTSKTFSMESVTENNATESYLAIVAGLGATNNAITRIDFSIFSGNLTSTSTASIYGITAGSDGIVTTS
jgi:hypothetical protein